jgi:hypothetical protein
MNQSQSISTLTTNLLLELGISESEHVSICNAIYEAIKSMPFINLSAETLGDPLALSFIKSKLQQSDFLVSTSLFEPSKGISML